MNKITIVLMAMSIMSCSGVTKMKESKEAEQKITAVPESPKGEVININRVDFLQNVFNYENNPETWKYEGKKPCIIDFYADWCGPCKKVSPILQDLAAVYKNDIIVYKLNVDQEGEVSARFGISSIPSLLFIPMDGKPKMSVGAMPREEIISQIENFLLKK